MALKRDGSKVTPLGSQFVHAAERVVLFADMVSYTQRIEEDESATLEFMTGCFDTLRVLAIRHSGTLIKTLGDGALLVFDDSDGALSCGLEFQRAMSAAQSASDAPYQFRVGLHRGEIVRQNGDVFGNTVNIAARLQSMALPGTCIASEKVVEAATNARLFRFGDMGVQKLKNIQEAIHLFRVERNPAASRSLAAMPLFRVEALGDAVTFEPDQTPISLDHPDAFLLLAYLSLCSGRSDALDRLVALFYPGLEHSAALDRLDAALASIDASTRAHAQIINRFGEVVALDGMACTTDLDEMVVRLRGGQVPDVLIDNADWPEQILSTCSAASATLQSWLRITRDNWKRRILKHLEQVMDLTTEDNREHRRAADAILALEPGHEVAALSRVETFLAENDPTAAHDEYERLRRYLAKTFGTRPGKKISARIKAAKSSRESARRTALSPVRPRRILRIAVGQILPVSEDSLPELTAFRAELIANLMRFRDWSIIDATRDTPAPEGSGPNIDYVLELETLGPSGPANFRLELRSHATNRVVWTDSYAVTEADWHSAMTGIIRNVVMAIELYVSSDRLAATYSTNDPDATSFDLWLRGDRALMRWTPEGAEEARGLFESILQNDPNHAPALFRLASIENIAHIIWPGRTRSEADAKQADVWASKAAELDPMDARIQRTVAWTAAMNGAFARASMHMDLAAQLNPNCVTTLASCAMGFAWFGERAKADALLTRLNAVGLYLPDWIRAYNASTLFFLERYDDALVAAELAQGSIVDNDGWVAAVQVCKGDLPAAAAAFDALCTAVEPTWAGEKPLTKQAVADWFSSAFPIRREDDRMRLSQAISDAVAAA